MLARARSLIEQVEGSNIIIPEETGHFSLDNEFVRRVQPLLDECITLLREVSEHYETESSAKVRETAVADGEDDFLREIGAQISTEMAARELSDLAFVSRAQLVEIRDNLAAALEQKQVWAVASAASAAVRRSGRALVAVETAICEFEGLETPQRRWVDLDDSLSTRRQYSILRRAIMRRDNDDDSTLENRLRGAGRRIAIFRKREIYPYLRIEDRRVIKDIQRRIHDCLQAGDGATEEGRRLWQDLMSFAGLLSSINEREELREHDRKLLRSLNRRFFAGARSRPAKLTPLLREELAALEGLDDELDDLLANLDDDGTETLRQPFERLLAQFDRQRAISDFGPPI